MAINANPNAPLISSYRKTQIYQYWSRMLHNMLPFTTQDMIDQNMIQGSAWIPELIRNSFCINDVNTVKQELGVSILNTTPPDLPEYRHIYEYMDIGEALFVVNPLNDTLDVHLIALLPITLSDGKSKAQLWRELRVRKV